MASTKYLVNSPFAPDNSTALTVSESDINDHNVISPQKPKNLALSSSFHDLSLDSPSTPMTSASQLNSVHSGLRNGSSISNPAGLSSLLSPINETQTYNGQELKSYVEQRSSRSSKDNNSPRPPPFVSPKTETVFSSSPSPQIYPQYNYSASSARSAISALSSGRSFATPREAFSARGQDSIRSNSDEVVSINISRITAAAKIANAAADNSSVISQKSNRSQSSQRSYSQHSLRKGDSEAIVEGLTRQEQIESLFSKVRNGRFEEVEEILQSRLFPADVRDSYGNTLLIAACQNGSKRFVKLALRMGVNPNLQNFKGCTGLHYCFSFQYVPLAEYLISKGAKDTIVNNSGLTCYEGLTRDD